MPLPPRLVCVFSLFSTSSSMYRTYFLFNRSARKPKHVNHGKPGHAMKTIMEASLGKPVGKSIAQVRKFLQHDKTKLVYYCLWADPSLYGETRPYVMNFYLADDCVEVVEVASNMTGRDPFPSLLKKQRLPKHNVGNLNDGLFAFPFSTPLSFVPFCFLSCGAHFKI